MNKLTQKGPLIFIGSSILLAAIIIFILFGQYIRLNNEYDQLITDNLETFTKGQVTQTKGQIKDVQNTLKAISTLTDKTVLSPGEEWLNIYLNQLDGYSDEYKMDYISFDDMVTGMHDRQASQDDVATYYKLAAGQEVISNIRYSNRLGDYYFAIAEPIKNNGEIDGALRVRMPASLLCAPQQSSQFYDKVMTCIIDSQNNILYSNSSEYIKENELIKGLESNDLSQDSIDTIESYLEDGKSHSFQVPGTNKPVFIAIDDLGYKDWRVINFLKYEDITYGYGSILNSVMAISIVLILLITIAAILSYIFILGQKKKMQWENKRYEMLAQFTDTILFEYIPASDTIKFTPNALEVLGINSLSLKKISRPDYEMSLLHPAYRQSILSIFQQSPKDIKPEDTGYKEAMLKVKDGSYRWFSCQYKYIFNGDELEGIIGKLTDIAAQISTREILEKKASTDTLTNTYNKAGEKVISTLLDRNPTGAFFMLDLDNFKQINDTCGHVAGDTILSSIGNYLNNIVRTEDVVARIGGDEFVIFIHDAMEVEAAEEIAQRILTIFEKTPIPENPELSVSASVGIAFSPEHGITYQELYQAADEAMYTVKHKTKGSYAIYQPPQEDK